MLRAAERIANPMTEHVIIGLSSYPDETGAERLGHQLVTEGLAACVTRVPGARSTYLWEGSIQDEAEVLLIIKTTAARLPALKSRLQALHPYEVPELVILPVTDGNEPYLAWVAETVRAGIASEARTATPPATMPGAAPAPQPEIKP